MAGARPGSGSSPASQAPSLWVPLRYWIVAQASFLAVLFWAPVGADRLFGSFYQGQTLALTHLLALGWITMTTMGASFQLVPVALETTLYSERMARWQFWFMLLGTATMVIHFWSFQFRAVAVGAGLVLVAVILYAINLGRTLFQLDRWDIVARHVVAALLYLLATTLLGGLMALNKVSLILGADALRMISAHAHLAGVGWVSMMILGVGYKLIPMFSLGELGDERIARWQFWLINLGLVGLFVSLLVGSRLVLPFALAIAGAIGLFLCKMIAVLRGSRRPKLDWGLWHAVSALIYLVLASLVGLWLASGRGPDGSWASHVAFGYTVLALLGWMSVMIVGMTYKILPFLVWHHRYSDVVGLRPVPTATEFVGEDLPGLGFWILHCGILTLVAGLVFQWAPVIQVGAMFLATAGALFGIALFRIYRHLAPRLTPLPEAKSAGPDARPGDGDTGHPRRTASVGAAR